MTTRGARVKWAAAVLALATVWGTAAVPRAWGESATVGGVTWSYTVSGTSATVTGASPAKGNLTIPSSLGEYRVTGIGRLAFEECRNMTGVTIPNSVTNIEELAFANCRGLTNVTIPDSVTSVGRGVFYECRYLTNATISAGLTNLSENMFYFCERLKTITIPDSVTSIQNGAFDNCSDLASVTIGKSVTSIENHAFTYCSNLTDITIPDNVTSIGEDAFYWCSSLTNIVIGKGVASIGQWAFNACSKMKTLYIPISWRGKYVDGLIWSSYACVPSECEIVYYEPKAATSTGVPYVWLEENAGEALAAAGGDYEAAARAKAANGRKVWECYVAGLSTTNAAEEFTTEISFSNGVPKVSWKPDLNEGGKKKAREYVVEGKPGMLEEWGATNSESRFFRVKVGMP